MNLGDLKLSILLDIVKAEKGSKQLSASLKQLDAEHGKVTNSAKRLETQSVSLKSKMQNLGLTVEGIRAGFGILRATFGDMINAYNQQEIASAKLTNGLKNVGEGLSSVNRLKQQASDFQKITVYDDDEIINAQSMLTTFMKSSDEIEVLTPRILDLAAAFDQSGDGGKSLQEVAVMLGKVNEETIGALRRVGVAFSKEQEEKLKSLRGTEQAIYLTEILDSNFKGMAQTIGQTAGGQLKIFQNNVGNLKEEFGKLLSDALTPLLTPLGKVIDYLNNAPTGVKQSALAISSLAIAFTFLNGSIPISLKFLLILAALIPALPSQLKAVAIALIAVAGSMALINSKADILKSGLNTLATSSTSSIARFAASASSNFGVVGVAISLLVGWVTLLIGKLKTLSEEKENYEYWEKKREEGSVTMTTPDGSEYDITDPKNINKVNTHSFVYTPGKGFMGQENNQIDVSSDQNIKKGQDAVTDSVKKLGGAVDDTNEKTVMFKSTLEELNEELAKINERIGNQTVGENFASGLFGQKKDLENKIELIRAINTNFVDYIKLQDQIATQGGAERRIGIAPEPEDEMLKFNIKRQQSEKNKSDRERSNQAMESGLSSTLSLAQQISNTLNLGADNFITNFIGGLQKGLSLANSFASFLNLVLGAGSGGIFGLLGFASGGTVPGSGSGDTVPAMLTPGEFVINKRRASQLGMGFLQWLNGGGTVNSNITPSMIGGGNLIINANGKLTDALSFEIVDKGTKVRNVKINKSTY